jgi:hypothetical protein
MSSIRLENLRDIIAHIEQFGTTPLYFRSGNDFVIIASRLSWKGDVELEDYADFPLKKSGKGVTKADALEQWLVDHSARKIKEYTDWEALFGK